MKLHVGRTIFCAITFILLEGLISTQQTDLASSSPAITKEGKKDVGPVNPASTDVKKTSVVPVVSKKNTTKAVIQRTFYVPDRSPTNMTPEQMKELTEEDEEEIPAGQPGQGSFDNKAVQRALIVMAGIAFIVVAYLGVKFFCLRKRKVTKRYGRVEASEMDLLDEIEEEDESEEEEELFDINKQRRS